MSGARLTMRKISEVLRLRFDCNRGYREIAKSCKISISTAFEIISKFKNCDLSWPLPVEFTEEQLEKKLYPQIPEETVRPMPDWNYLHTELKKKHVTIRLLWEEYSKENKDSYGYAWFCDSFRNWVKKTEVTMLQAYKFGEKCFIDYAGDTIDIIDPISGEITKAQIFIGVLGASNYTYAEATISQDILCWLNSNLRMFEFFGGVPEISIPDNLKSGVTKACHYDPDLNQSYLKLAKYYGTIILPARIKEPRDKAKVEGAVLIVERWILATLRNMKFYSIAELNLKIRELLTELNNKPFQKLPFNRKEYFEKYEKPALKPLPVVAYEIGKWIRKKVGINYHVEIDRHFYSVPYKYAKEEVEVHITFSCVEIFHKNVRVASHMRSRNIGGNTTVADHMPSHHRIRAEWNRDRIINWAATIGDATQNMAREIMDHKPHPELGFKACFGLFGIAKKYGNDRLESACKLAISFKAYSYKSVKSILLKGLDKQAHKPTKTANNLIIMHKNIRGAEYYAEKKELIAGV